MVEEKKKKNLKKIYYDLKNVGSYGGVRKLKNATHEVGVESWLSSQPTYSLHKPRSKRFPTRKYQTSGLNHLWQMDFVEMIPFARINKGYKYILTCIDVFSRFAQALPLKSKSGQDVSRAISKMISPPPPPLSIQTDLGKEFYNTHVKALFKKHHINHYTVHSQFKAALVERFNRTLREKLNRYFTHAGHKRWYDALPTIIETYNKSKHRGIFNLRPIDITKKNEMQLWQQQQQQQQQQPKKQTQSIKLLDNVRISQVKATPFVKNFDQNWSEEIFRVVGIDSSSQPVMYTIEDLQNNVLTGKFYKQELQVISKMPSLFRIEKIIKSKGKGKYKQYLVKWHGYPTTYNSWIQKDQIQHE